jgi:hypothetical protein
MGSAKVSSNPSGAGSITPTVKQSLGGESQFSFPFQKQSDSGTLPSVGSSNGFFASNCNAGKVVDQPKHFATKLPRPVPTKSGNSTSIQADNCNHSVISLTSQPCKISSSAVSTSPVDCMSAPEYSTMQGDSNHIHESFATQLPSDSAISSAGQNNHAEESVLASYNHKKPHAKNPPSVQRITKSRSKAELLNMRLSMHSLNQIESDPFMVMPPPEFKTDSDSTTNIQPPNNSWSEKAVGTWSSLDVSDWLRHMKLGEHVERFERKLVDGAKLVMLDRQGLIGLGMTSLEHRRDFELGVRKLTRLA